LSLKKLACQTIWYGVSNIAARFLSFILTPLVTYLLHTRSGQAEYGDFSVLYAAIPFVNVIFTYGIETAYFRFSSQGTPKGQLFQTTFSSLLLSTIVFSAVLILFRQPIANYLGISNSVYISWCILIIALDTLAAVPFARLRQEEKPRKYAFTKVAGILLNISLTLFFLAWSPLYVANHPLGAYAMWYHKYNNTGFLILANLLQNVLTFLLLYKVWSVYRFEFSAKLWRKVFNYGAPMIIVGLGGMVNETIDRIMLRKLLPVGADAAKIAVGVYSANYKLAIFITLFIQAFKMSAEPFFFNQAADKNAPAIYARVMKWFVITLCMAFLFTALFLDVWKYLEPDSYRWGLGVVPILLLANIALGVYYNLSVWYKMTDKMAMGMYITIIGATLTLVLNYLFVPIYGMMACAWTTLAAYASMMVISYFWGQRHFPVPYATRKLCGYLIVIILLFFAEKTVQHFSALLLVRLAAALGFVLLFIALVIKQERAELKKMPIIGRFIA
jgi:O-antigen/teichoic acid export membrane protein